MEKQNTLTPLHTLMPSKLIHLGSDITLSPLSSSSNPASTCQSGFDSFYYSQVGSSSLVGSCSPSIGLTSVFANNHLTHTRPSRDSSNSLQKAT
ncbi:unnamed protein product [Protopolystoma xenopodis]|uniref:Uncharacterized protein n=1 Tax=Protopolystoma xenopodis TaxID=117903 RepID=A0A448XPH9_9PLAT|nr:unnamed protein product [Protopolystoma xenopodis]